MEKSYIRWGCAWVYFIIGHIMSKLEFLDRGLLTGKAYQYTMSKSSDIQGNSDFGPWNEVTPKN